MTHKESEKYLENRGIRPTANRILVLGELGRAGRPLSLADLESSLDTMDRASIFRVLELFAGKDIVHTIEDGSRSLKYELCGGEHGHTPADGHVHFYCENCRTTYCLEDIAVPEAALPDGFHARAVNYMVKGLCPRCAKSR